MRRLLANIFTVLVFGAGISAYGQQCDFALLLAESRFLTDGATPYARLGVRPGAGTNEIELFFDVNIRRWLEEHGELTGTERFYDDFNLLTNPSTKQNYDRTRGITPLPDIAKTEVAHVFKAPLPSDWQQKIAKANLSDKQKELVETLYRTRHQMNPSEWERRMLFNYSWKHIESGFSASLSRAELRDFDARPALRFFLSTVAEEFLKGPYTLEDRENLFTSLLRSKCWVSPLELRALYREAARDIDSADAYLKYVEFGMRHRLVTPSDLVRLSERFEEQANKLPWVQGFMYLYPGLDVSVFRKWVNDEELQNTR